MKSSKRLRRIERHNKTKKQPVLNLVSLMDIFTILVFFLLVNSSNTQQLPSTKELTLPTSISSKAPKETLLITVTKKDLLVQGVRVASIDSIMQEQSIIITALLKELEFQSAKSTADNALGKAVTIMGDENMGYDLVSKILKTCQQANYRQIAFAAHEQKAINNS